MSPDTDLDVDDANREEEQMTYVNRRAAMKQVLAVTGALAVAPMACAPANTPDPPKAAEPKPTASAPTAVPKAAPPTPAPSDTATGSAPTVAPAATTNAPVTIEYWHINNEAGGLPAVHEQIEAFRAQHPEITVEERFHADSYPGLLQNLQVALAARRPPAVAQIGHQYLSYVPANLPHTPIDELAKDDRAFLDRFDGSVLALGRFKGTLHGMPFSLSNPITYANADLLAAAGLNADALPMTWEDTRAAARTVKERTGKYGIYLATPPDNWISQALIESNGGRVANEDGTEALFDAPEAVEAMGFWGEMAHGSKVLPLLTLDEGRQSFLNGDVAMIVQTVANLARVRSNARFPFRTAPFPQFGSKPRRVAGGGNSLYVFATDRAQQAAAWTWVKFLAGPEGQTIWTKGTGYVPLPRGVADDPRYLKPFLEENAQVKPALDQLANMVPWAAFAGKNGPQVERTLVEARDQILAGQRDARSALADAAERARALLA